MVLRLFFLVLKSDRVATTKEGEGVVEYSVSIADGGNKQ